MSRDFLSSTSSTTTTTHPSIYNIPALTAAEHGAKLQKCMEEQEAKLRAATEEEQQAAEEEQVATEKKAVKKLSKKWKTVEPAAGQEAEGSKAPKKKKLKAKVVKEDMKILAEATVVPCKQ